MVNARDDNAKRSDVSQRQKPSGYSASQVIIASCGNSAGQSLTVGILSTK